MPIWQKIQIKTNNSLIGWSADLRYVFITCKSKKTNRKEMKILAIEKDLKIVDWKKESQTLIEEAKAAYNMLLSDSLREIYFTENKNAVLVLECENKTTAKQLLSKLLLVEKKIIDFEIMELQPYTGFSRLMDIE